jgi:hypothetical protein
MPRALALLPSNWVAGSIGPVFGLQTHMKRFLKALVLVLRVCLSAQAATLPAVALLCEEDPAHMHEAMSASHGHHDHSDGEDRHSDGDDSFGQSVPHACCHHLFSAALPTIIALPDSVPSGVMATPLFHPEFFIADRLKRPPLTSLI